jgi:hypothetical protein
MGFRKKEIGDIFRTKLREKKHLCLNICLIETVPFLRCSVHNILSISLKRNTMVCETLPSGGLWFSFFFSSVELNFPSASGSSCHCQWPRCAKRERGGPQRPCLAGRPHAWPLLGPERRLRPPRLKLLVKQWYYMRKKRNRGKFRFKISRIRIPSTPY